MGDIDRNDDYEDETGIRDYMITKRAAEIFDDVIKMLDDLSKKIPDEERKLLKDLADLSEELLTTCCADHFIDGMKTGMQIAVKSIKKEKEKHLFLSDDNFH